MNRDQKAAVVDEIAEQFQSADAVFAVDYRGISVAQAAELRDRLREVDSRFRVVKNSLSERAADRAGMESLKPMLTGPTALTFVSGDAAAAAKALNDAARAMSLLAFKGGILDGALLSPDDVRSIARLPGRDALIAQLVGTIAAPLTGLARTLNALVSGLAIQLQAIVDMDPPALVTAEAPAAAAEAAPAAEAPAAAEEAPAAEAPAAAAEAAPAAEAPAAEHVPAAAEDVPAAADAAEAPPAVAEDPPAVAVGPPAVAEDVPAAGEPPAHTEPQAPALAEPPAQTEPEAPAEPETQTPADTETAAASDAAESDD